MSGEGLELVTIATESTEILLACVFVSRLPLLVQYSDSAPSRQRSGRSCSVPESRQSRHSLASPSRECQSLCSLRTAESQGFLFGAQEIQSRRED